MLPMKQTARIISTYTGDTSGVCSALFELGGMTVMHDASGCNSTYSTHDEPRWYDSDSLVFLSGLTEMDAILGNDDKLIKDVVSAAKEFSPRFVAIAGTPIPMMTGVDFQALAKRVEEETDIPSFGFATNGMHSYISGASMAFSALAERMCTRGVKRDQTLSVNLLGVTPLDFSVNGSDRSMKAWLEDSGFAVRSVWAMGSSLEEIQSAGKAQVNLVVSACGLAAAKILREIFGTPYVVGTPFGHAFSAKIIRALRTAAGTGENIIACCPSENECDTAIIGESVTSLSLAAALRLEKGICCRVLCPVETSSSLLSQNCLAATDEEELIPFLRGMKRVIADPLYRPICPADADFLPLPNEAFSGRIFRESIPNLVSNFNSFEKEVKT